MRLLALLLIVAAAPLVQADILHLRDGSRHYGELVERTDQAVVFRISLDTDGSAAVQRFSAVLVERIERTGRRDEPPAVGPQEAGPESEVERGADDFGQMMREVHELLADGDRRAALRALERIVREAPREALDELRAANDGVGLDTLTAQTRIEAALAADGSSFRITRATDMERAALGRHLSQYETFLLDQRYDGRRVREWAQAREAYTTLSEDAPALVRDAARAAAVIRVRLRFDPVLDEQQTLRRDLHRLRHDLSRLAAHVLAMRGYTALPRTPSVDPVKRFRDAVRVGVAGASPAGVDEPGAAGAVGASAADETTGDFAP